MNCRVIQSKLLDYMDGDLYAGQRLEMAAHLERCPRCRAEYQEMNCLADTCVEFVAYPDAPYPFSALRARMAAITPLEEVAAYLPRMRATGLAGQFAVAALLLVFAFALPAFLRQAHQFDLKVKQALETPGAKWGGHYLDVLDDLDRELLAGNMEDGDEHGHILSEEDAT